jgi:hypothetical protein
MKDHYKGCRLGLETKTPHSACCLTDFQQAANSMPANELTHIICLLRHHAHCGPAGSTIWVPSVDISHRLAATWRAAAKPRQSHLAPPHCTWSMSFCHHRRRCGFPAGLVSGPKARRHSRDCRVSCWRGRGGSSGRRCGRRARWRSAPAARRRAAATPAPPPPPCSAGHPGWGPVTNMGAGEHACMQMSMHACARFQNNTV